MKNQTINSSQAHQACLKIEQLVDLYLDGELEQSTKHAVDGHIAKCESCAKTYSQTSELIELAKTLKNTPIPEGVRVRLRTALQKQIGFPTLTPKALS